MADANPSRPSVKDVEGAEKAKPKADEKVKKANGREFIESKIQGKVCRTFIDDKKA